MRDKNKFFKQITYLPLILLAFIILVYFILIQPSPPEKHAVEL